ncbi:organic hydroperoxide resistance protein [Chitinophaga polysaccharea]|uniref:organic hydroperoxide resistance protein n=1 Tax=Chitinophaga TaxID=79328 RepID=UPI00145576E6|nr:MULTISPECIES: organic hydroperoxide resistance protein [Chitinophaga]NLR57923.1 organic hydroperoxide resistance protein [Chitinophaga polysaccharea]NLU93516.1 organic hydroperoxide resistance protein [Chitinophaga sp. Ak27]
MATFESIYTAHATVVGGRNGHVTSSDGVLDLDVRIPKEMGGSGGAYTNPEQLFAAGYAACFDGALNLVIRTEKVRTGTTRVTAAVSLGKDEAGNYGLAVKLEVAIPDTDRELAQSLIEKAHQVCPYSRATRGNINVELALI